MRRLLVLVCVLAVAVWLPVSLGRGVDRLTPTSSAPGGADCARTGQPVQDHVLAPHAGVAAGSSQAQLEPGAVVSRFPSPASDHTHSSLLLSGALRLHAGRPPLVFPLLI